VRYEFAPGETYRGQLYIDPGSRFELRGGECSLDGAVMLPTSTSQGDPILGTLELMFNCRNASLADLARDFGAGGGGELDGLLGAAGFVRGSLGGDDPWRYLQGACRLSFEDATLPGLGALDTISGALGSISETEFSSLRGNILLDKGKLWTTNLRLKHPAANARLEFAAPLPELTLNGRVYVEAAAANSPFLQLTGLKQMAQLVDGLSNTALALTIEGAVFAPEVRARPIQNIMDREGDPLPPTDDPERFPFRIPNSLKDMDWSGEEAGS
jgi:hypothetical protein